MRSAVLGKSSRSIAILLLIASAPVLSDCSRLETLLTEPIVVTVVRCPPLTEYPPETQKKAAEELRALPAGSTVATLVADYGTTRAKCRAYEKKSTAE
jgi:hypothetical protein